MKNLLRISVIMPLLAVGCGSLNAPNQPSGLPVCYHNSQYDFTFVLPVSWLGYSVVRQEWGGISYLPAKDTTALTAHGPTVVLRHPQWKADAPYQDIPIMIFTRSQWESDKQGKFSIGAGGFDEEIEHNSKYVFGISSRFDADDTVKGFQEAAAIVEWNRAANVSRLYQE